MGNCGLGEEEGGKKHQWRGHGCWKPLEIEMREKNGGIS